MTNLDPNSRDRLRNDPMMSEPVTRDRGGMGMGMIGLLAAIAVLILAGLFFWSAGDGDQTATTTTSPGTTTGASPTTPAPPAKTTPAPSTPPATGNSPAQPSK